MSTDTQTTDIRLERMKALVDMKVKLMKAYANYNYRMMQVLELRAKVETKYFKLEMLRDAYIDFKRARTQLLKEQRSEERRLSQIARHLKYVRYLGQGEILQPSLVMFAWIGLKALLNNSPLDVFMSLSEIEITDEHRKGKYFCHNLTPEEKCKDAPKTVRNVQQLIDFMRVRSYMPRLNSPPYFMILQVIAIMEAEADERATTIEERLDEVENELRTIRLANWEKVDIDVEPKSVEDTETD